MFRKTMEFIQFHFVGMFVGTRHNFKISAYYNILHFYLLCENQSFEATDLSYLFKCETEKLGGF